MRTLIGLIMLLFISCNNNKKMENVKPQNLVIKNETLKKLIDCEIKDNNKKNFFIVIFKNIRDTNFIYLTSSFNPPIKANGQKTTRNKKNKSGYIKYKDKFVLFDVQFFNKNLNNYVDLNLLNKNFENFEKMRNTSLDNISKFKEPELKTYFISKFDSISFLGIRGNY